MNDVSTAKMIVVGAGISGMRAALSLAELGYQVLLIDKAPATGGILTQLDHQFPNNHCGMCRILPMVERDQGAQFCLRKGLFHENITLVSSTEVIAVSGTPGNLSVTLKTTPTGIDKDRCVGCGDCEKVCPVTVPDLFNAGLCERKAVYLPVPHHIPNTRVIDWKACTRCNACIEACPTGAVRLDDKPHISQMEPVATVILATGSQLFDPSSTEFYGMSDFPNVVTATAFERIMSGSGPYAGKLLRPSDGKEAKRIAWLQCVGSRNPMIHADYCSRACCMFAVKEAVLATGKIGKGAQTAIFYMDMRTYGRDYQAYRDRAEHEYGVRFVRCRIHSVEPADGPGDLRITYVDSQGKQAAEDFDMVVLSTGQAPEQKLPDFAQHEGVFIVDPDLGLRDISESIVRAEVASGRAAKTAHALGLASFRREERSEKGKRTSVWKQPPNMQVILCTCHGRLDKQVDWEAIEQGLKNLPDRLQVARVYSLCAQSGWDTVTQMLETGHANRVLLGACNPYVFGPRIKDLEKDTEIPASLVEVVDVLGAAGKHTDAMVRQKTILAEVEMALSRLRTRSLPTRIETPVNHTALVVGGGPAGLKAAAVLAGHDLDVVLVEKTDRLGGNLPGIQNSSVREKIENLINKIDQHPRISVRYETEVVHNTGRPGRFSSRLRHRSGREETLQHGAVILATGGKALRVESNGLYGMGQHERIVSLFAFEKQLADPAFVATPIESVVMIQCVGSREKPNNYCSRICCVKSLESALRIRDLHPEARVYIFYRDMMTYGRSEQIYTTARKNGIYFIPFDLTRRPSVGMEADRIIVEGRHPILGKDIKLEPDWVVLAAGIGPNRSEKIAEIFGIETTEHGFFKEADTKWRPVDSSREGIFVCGLAKAPVRADEAMREGAAAAQRALRILTKKSLSASSVVARVRHSLCSLCESCIPVCPYHARYLDREEGKVMVDTMACQACGVCAVTCPNSATVIDGFDDQGIMHAIEAAL